MSRWYVPSPTGPPVAWPPARCGRSRLGGAACHRPGQGDPLAHASAHHVCRWPWVRTPSYYVEGVTVEPPTRTRMPVGGTTRSPRFVRSLAVAAWAPTIGSRATVG